MNFLAAATESVSHPATMLVVGALLAAVLKGRAASIAMVAAPLLGLSFVIGLEPGSFSTVSLFGLEIKSVAVDKQAKLFGYLFHIAALIAGIYSFHLRDRWQVSMALLYAASAVGVAFAGDMLSLFSGGRLSPSLRFFKFGREGPKSPKNRVFGTFSFMFLRDCFYLPES